MAITFPCVCGKRLKVNGELAGRRIKCPACGAAVAVPAADRLDLLDLEPVAAPPDEVGARRKGEGRKKKKKRKEADRQREREAKEEAYQQWRLRSYWRRRLLRGLAFIVLGLITAAAATYLLARHREDVNPVYSAVFLALGVIGVAKGGIGIVAGQFFGEED